MANQINYPTAWEGGIPRGSIKEEASLYRVTISASGVPQYTKSFYFNLTRNNGTIPKDQIFNNKAEALKAAKKYQMQESDKHKVTRNKWRKIDADTIEVKAGDDKTFFTDFKYVKQVEQYPVFAKKAHNKFHIISQDKKRQFPFYNLVIPDVKIIEYIDGNTLNLRKSNLKELGSVEVSKKVQDKAKTDKSIDLTIDQYATFRHVEFPYFLPRNKWILGKPAGTVFESNGVINARISTGDVYASKTFRFTEETKEKKYESARRWQYNTSYKLGLTKNLIRILDNELIEVQISKDLTTIADIAFVQLIQNMSICATRSSNEGAKQYAMASVNDTSYKLHNVLCQNVMTDHYDGDPLNNTLANLRSCTHSINNSNRHFAEEAVGYEKTDRDGDKCIFSKIKIEKKVFEKYFYFDKTKTTGKEYEKEKKKLQRHAYLYRRFVLYGEWDDELIPYVSHRDFRLIEKNVKRLREHHIKSTLNMTDYFKSLYKQTGIKLTSLEETNIYILYNNTRFDIRKQYFSMLDDNSEIMFNLFKKTGSKEKLSDDDIKKLTKIIQDKGGLIMTAFNDKDPVTIKCNCGYKFNITGSELMAGKYCYSCHDNTIEKVTRDVVEELSGKTFKKVRPEWLRNTRGNQMEIDMFNEELKLGVEYNGEQHSKISFYTKTQEKLDDRKENDKLKLKLCRSKGITVISVPHTCNTAQSALLADLSIKSGNTRETIKDFISTKFIELGYD